MISNTSHLQTVTDDSITTANEKMKDTVLELDNVRVPDLYYVRDTDTAHNIIGDGDLNDIIFTSKLREINKLIVMGWVMEIHGRGFRFVLRG